jgi:hypothetical protein
MHNSEGKLEESSSPIRPEESEEKNFTKIMLERW